MVGSTMSGFGLESSDIDMCLLTKPCTNDPRLDSLHHLNAIRHLLVKYGKPAFLFLNFFIESSQVPNF